ncbi:hypothetical protein OU792_18620, partial [Algoriphagus sp. NF]|nr:hypothetical protein [Algoriphagus sp. NF]
LRFPIDSDTKALLCSEVGYRKVFIDLKPDLTNPGFYTITVDMLVNSNGTPRVVNIFSDVPYGFLAPNTLKLGFAAATGSPHTNFHEIRNVEVQVSSIQENQKPQPPSLLREVCIDQSDDVEFPFCVNLPSSINAFIQCIQLYELDPGPGVNNFGQENFDCGLVCDERCSDQNKRIPVYDPSDPTRQVGELIAELSDEVEPGEFNQALIRYVRTDLSFYGTVTAWYKIVDNFGLESDGIPITITINPLPEIVFKGIPENPSCDGQNDGKITGIVIDNLVDDPGKYQVEFYDANGPVNTTLVSETYNAEGYITATFDLSGLNLGSIFVRATNPSSESLGPPCNNNTGLSADPCMVEDELIFEFTETRGTPVELDPYRDEICESEIFEVLPTIDPIYNPNN